MDPQIQETLKELQNDKNELLNTNYELVKNVKNLQSLLQDVFRALEVQPDENGNVNIESLKARIDQLNGKEFEEVTD